MTPTKPAVPGAPINGDPFPRTAPIGPPNQTRRPMFIPKQPPPRGARRWDGTLPELGTWVIVTTTTDTFKGRVIIAEPDRIRIRAGAGFWDVDTAKIIRIEAGDDPKRITR